NWTTGLDPEAGKAIVRPEARYDVTGKPFLAEPGPMGAHSWQPMSYSPKTGLVYVPMNFSSSPFAADDAWKPTDVGYQSAQDPLLWALPPDQPTATISMGNGALMAWDPLAARQVWRAGLPLPGNGGVLATGGNLVFHGTTGGLFHAYSATSGKRLWSFDAQSGIIAAPMTYRLDGEQYVAILAGWGGGWGGAAIASPATRNISRLLVFKLGAKQALPPVAKLAQAPLDPPPSLHRHAAAGAGRRQDLWAILFRLPWGVCGRQPALSGPPALSDAG
ncbi:MAG: PQQ-binding-like beta-propeller repeat protein, partial [Novosphingobium sp.]|nr:PQQ-binding-like beta-propeller repeat protein [Novosphingobium sp.]